MKLSRREGLGFGLAAAGIALTGCEGRGDDLEPASAQACGPWGRGFDGQRIADRGDGQFMNPILSGDRPDLSIIKDGDTYYLTCSSLSKGRRRMIGI
jgi:xylan 1,4-beta-xylosidase